jgi:coproporphyrinogen III oxidase
MKELFRNEVSSWFRELQLRICSALENADGKGKFHEDEWKRQEGGGGKSRILVNGSVIEKGGVNFSAVFGKTPDFLKSDSTTANSAFFATGVSVVMHPHSPMVPIIHMNVRYFENDQDAWFGGGIDLTPHYVKEEDAEYFHLQLKQMCDRHHHNFYPEFKKQADDYFFIPHRNETRGIGGIFFDHLRGAKDFPIEKIFEFVKDTGNLFPVVYSEIMARNRNRDFDDSNIEWQRLRRGRYAEFNLVYDKGTKFGLETGGRTESILMSLPPLASWKYDYHPEPGTYEAKTLQFLKKGIDWTRDE